MARRKTYHGYTNMGRVRVPPLPVHIIMTDRDDGTEWVLIHTSDGEIGVNDEALGNHKDFQRFGPYDGPYLPRVPQIRLFVRGGRLGYEYETLPPWLSDRDQRRVMTRRGTAAEAFEVIVPVEDEPWQQEGDELGVREFIF